MSAPVTTHPHEGNEDGDSALGDVFSSSEDDDASVLSETEQYVEENRRTYHAPWINGRYLLPNDKPEQERLDVQHALLIDTDGLHKAPVQGLLNVLDVGTGTGQWAIALAEEYPSAVVTAIDIAPNVMPNWTHPNCWFLVDDAENELGMGNEKFDYIHVRLFHGFRHPIRFIGHAWEALVPGGYLEIKEFEFPLQFHDPERAKTSALTTWLDIVIAGSSRLGIDLTITDKISMMLVDRGFENVEESISAWPIGTWPKKKRRRMLATKLQGYWLETLAAFIWRPSREMDWHNEETQVLLAKARSEICGQKVRATMHVRTFWARKPHPA